MAGCLDPNGYIYIAIDKKDYAAHRIAWIYVHGEEPSGELDHINLVKSDNCIKNLRIATHAQNCANRKRRSDNTTGYKGVYRERGKYRSYIVVQGRNHRIGTFHTPEEAARAYADAARKYAGEFWNSG